MCIKYTNEVHRFQAKPIIESGDVKGLLDPNLNGNINETHMHRMVLAATLCITRSARLRPKMSEVIKLLYLTKMFKNMEKFHLHFAFLCPDTGPLKRGKGR